MIVLVALIVAVLLVPLLGCCSSPDFLCRVPAVRGGAAPLVPVLVAVVAGAVAFVYVLFVRLARSVPLPTGMLGLI